MTLSEYILHHGLTNSAFAQRLGVNVSTVSRWLDGDTLPSHEMLLAVAFTTEFAVMPHDWFPYLYAMAAGCEKELEGGRARPDAA